MRKSWVYEIFRIILVFGLRLFHRKFRVVGYENLKGSEIPTIVVGNHQNALLDPILCCSVITQQLHWLTRSDVFKPGFVSAFLSKANMLPVYREKDNVPDLRDRNEAIFQECYKRLNRGQWISLFPEGTHKGKKSLNTPLKKGIGRLIIGTFEANPNLQQIRILPLGLEYSEFLEKDGDFMLRIGKPILLSKEDYTTANKAIWANELVADISAQLQAVMTDIRNDHYYEEYITIQDLIHFVYPHNDWHENVLIYQDMVNAKRFEKPALLEELKIFNQLSKELYFSNQTDLDAMQWRMWNTLRVFMTVPFSFVGKIIFFPISNFTENFVRTKVKDVLFRNSIRITFKIFLSIPYILILSIIFPFIGVNYFLGILLLITAGTFEVRARMRFDRFKKIIQHKKDCAKRTADYSTWKAAQEQCISQLKQICNEQN
jgi:1-acyl-sn-glycerol-3-phosphate acyltransferase